MDLGDNCPEQHAAGRTQPQKLIPGSALRHLAYSPYGYLSIFQAVLGFNGGRPDPVTGCYLLGNGRRVFNPALMRFISPDRMSPFAAGGLNSYAYCIGEPINRLDPSGNVPVVKLAKQFFGQAFSNKPALSGKPPTQKNLPASIKANRTDYTWSYAGTDYPMSLVIGTDIGNAPEGYKLFGLHGTKRKYIDSLESGPDINFSSGGMAGRGLYVTQSAELANNFAGADGIIMGVYVKDSSRWVESVHYSYVRRDVMVIHERAYYAVKVRRDIRFPIELSAAYGKPPSDEPYAGRNWF
ncbi:RHS repeat-associated core domain-containing protein [Pseudomonas hunanensis]|uniref:RHS repeat-associated core domain-containing protein n=1 Tax=Pseudomonas hunanensis TaxID=1247546 RepID=UPI0038168737